MIAFLALASAFAAPAADDAVFLTVAYCPDLFSGMGAVVRVNHTDGAFTIQGLRVSPRLEEAEEGFGSRGELSRRAMLRGQRRPALRSSAKSAAERLRPPRHRQTWSK